MALLGPAAAPSLAWAAADSDWPCEQIKVPELSLASVWAGPPVDPARSDWQDDPAVAALVQKLAPRRQPLDQAEPVIQAFARQAGSRKQAQLVALMAGLFSVLDQERDSVLSGLDRFGSRQKQLAQQIHADSDRLRALQREAAADLNALAELTRQIGWEVEVFQDRRQAIGYACDIPSRIEQRLFGLARQIQQALE